MLLYSYKMRRVKPTEPEVKKGRAKGLHGRLIATNNYFKKSYGEGVAVGL